MATKIHAKTEKFGIIRQNTAIAAATAFVAQGTTANQWTNPGLANTNYRTLFLTPGTVVPDPNVSVDEYNLTSQVGLHKEVSNDYVNSVSGLKRIPFSGLADKNTLSALLVSAMQAVSEGATPFEKIITSGFIGGPIDFKAGAGYLYSLAGNQGASADDGWIAENCIIDTLTLTWNFLQPGKGKLVGISGTFVSNEFNPEQTLSGSWVTPTFTPFNNSDTWSFTTFTVDSVDFKALCVKSISLTFNNSISSNCATSSGKANQYDVTPDWTWTITMDHNSTTEKLVGDYMAGANVSIDFVNSVTSGVDGFFRLYSTVGKLIANPPGYDNNYKSHTLTVGMRQTASVSPLTVNLVDGLDWGYPEP